MFAVLHDIEDDLFILICLDKIDIRFQPLHLPEGETDQQRRECQLVNKGLCRFGLSVEADAHTEKIICRDLASGDEALQYDGNGQNQKRTEDSCNQGIELFFAHRFFKGAVF